MWLRVGEAQRHLKQWRRAIDLFLMIDQYVPASRENAEAGFRRLLCLNELKDPSLPSVAEKVIDKIRAIDPNSDQIDLADFSSRKITSSGRNTNWRPKPTRRCGPKKFRKSLRGCLLFQRGWSREAGEATRGHPRVQPVPRLEPQGPAAPEALAKRGLAYKAAENWKSAQADFDRIIAKFGKAPVAELAYEQSALVQGPAQGHCRHDRHLPGTPEKISADRGRLPAPGSGSAAVTSTSRSTRRRSPRSTRRASLIQEL